MGKVKLGPDEMILREFEKGLRAWEESSGKSYQAQSEKGWNVFRISAIGECQAAMTYKWLGHEEEEKTVEGILRLHDGMMTHMEVREVFKLSDLKLIHEERELSKDYEVLLEGVRKVPIRLLGHQDNSFMHNGKEIVVDFKKASEYSYNKMEDAGISDAYWDQMQGYLDITRSEMGILFVKGVHGKAQAYTIERDEQYFHKEVLTRLAKTAILRKNNKIGKRDFHYGLPPCTYCPFQTQCWSTEDGELKDTSKLVSKTDPRYKEVLTVLDLNKQARETAEQADQLKSDARALAISLLRKFKSRKLETDKGGVSWTKFEKQTITLLEDKKQEALKKGLAKRSVSTIEYPLFTKGKS